MQKNPCTMILICFYCFIRIKHFEEDIVSINLRKNA